MSNPIIIVGNGISGITAARHIRKRSSTQIIIISKESSHFFSRTALMYVYMGHLKFEQTQPYENYFWKKNKLDLLQKTVTQIDPDKKQITLSDESVLSYSSLILAVGSTPNKFGWPGQDLKGVQGLYFKQDLESLEHYTPTIKHAVIVGGGLIGIELAEMLHARHIKATFLVREKSFWGNVLPQAESSLINRHILDNGIDLRLDTSLDEILPDENGRVKAIKTDKGELIDCQFVGLTAGVRPNIDFLKDTPIATNRGVLVNKFLETNHKDIYAIGDCAEQQEPVPGRRPIEAVWYTGRMMGETLAQTLTGNKTAYNPGYWFNSAKFFEIEYQTYGTVLAQPAENVIHFSWEPTNVNIVITIAYDRNTKKFLGINTFGIRMRHEIFDRWLSNNESIEYVLEHLADANFDPEFYKLHEADLIAKFNEENGTNIQLKKKSWKRIFSKV